MKLMKLKKFQKIYNIILFYDMENEFFSLCELCGYKKNDYESHDKNHMVIIAPYLYLGTKNNAHNMFELNTMNIEFIINAACEVDNKFYDFFEYIKLSWDDVPECDILKDLDIVVDKMNSIINQKKSVLVHCKAGISRSVSIIIAYLIKYENMKYTSAYDYVKSKKKYIHPNDGFISQLKLYELGCT